MVNFKIYLMSATPAVELQLEKTSCAIRKRSNNYNNIFLFPYRNFNVLGKYRAIGSCELSLGGRWKVIGGRDLFGS